ncbi:MAG: hypothetical protein RMX96_01745 [Nostoc sp. ChiSLP02]|nr:hypothetical protein [Nostoc sp. DedSLP05]MDZ8098814.1 hypothetical protein [Nostoc sp. DedSLP01]MDZ8183572.1 hypothetical protein [Nostoc sp. ChiSLP02]
MLVDGVFAQRRLFNTHNNGVRLAKAAAMMIEAYLTKLDEAD